MSKSQERRLKIQMKLSDRIRNDVIGIKRPADYWAEEVAQLEAENAALLKAISMCKCHPITRADIDVEFFDTLKEVDDDTE